MAKGIVRGLVAVLAGGVVWALLWNLGTRAGHTAFPELLTPDRPVSHAGALWGLIVYSVMLSVLAGFVTARSAGPRPMPAARVLAALQLTLGVWAEISFWSLMPVWYHLVFLALVVPSTLLGASLCVRTRGSSAVRAVALRLVVVGLVAGPGSAGLALTRADENDLSGAAAAVQEGELRVAVERLRVLFESGYPTPADVLADPRFVPLREDEDSRLALRDLLKQHVRQSTVTMVPPGEAGAPMRVLGRVVRSPDGAPVPGAELELYHTDATGRYEPSDSSVGEDSNSRLFAFVRTDEDGRFQVRSIKPAPYPGSGPGAAHVHFVVRADGYRAYAADFRPYDHPADPQERAASLARGWRYSTVRHEDELLVVEVVIPMRPG